MITRIVSLYSLSRRRLERRVARFRGYRLLSYEERPWLLFFTQYRVVLEQSPPDLRIELSLGPVLDIKGDSPCK